MLILVLLKQSLIMTLLVILGFFLSRRGFISEQGAKDLGSILLRVIIPCVIVKSCITAYSHERLIQFGQSFLLALVGFAISMLISWLVFRKRGIENFSAAFCNAGFIGIPLVQAVIGEDGVFFVSASIALLNLFQWTYGVFALTGDHKVISGRAIIKNPVVIAIAAGVAIYAVRIPIPEIIVSTLGYVAGMNTPVAMILLGTYMAKLPIKQIILDRRAYLCILFRLVIIPLAVLLVFAVIPNIDSKVKMATFIAAATPVGANICVFAQQYGKDYKLSVVTVCLSTILSIITMPLLVTLSQSFL